MFFIKNKTDFKNQSRFPLKKYKIEKMETVTQPFSRRAISKRLNFCIDIALISVENISHLSIFIIIPFLFHVVNFSNPIFRRKIKIIFSYPCPYMRYHTQERHNSPYPLEHKASRLPPIINYSLSPVSTTFFVRFRIKPI